MHLGGEGWAGLEVNEVVDDAYIAYSVNNIFILNFHSGFLK